MASISSSIYGAVVADVLHQASDDDFSTSSDDPTPTTDALAAMVVGRNKLQAFELREFAAKGKLVKVKALTKLSDNAKKVAPKDAAKPNKTAAANKPIKVAVAGLAVAWCFLIGLIFFTAFHRNPVVPHLQASVASSASARLLFLRAPLGVLYGDWRWCFGGHDCHQARDGNQGWARQRGASRRYDCSSWGLLWRFSSKTGDVDLVATKATVKEAAPFPVDSRSLPQKIHIGVGSHTTQHP